MTDPEYALLTALKWVSHDQWQQAEHHDVLMLAELRLVTQDKDGNWRLTPEGERTLEEWTR